MRPASSLLHSVLPALLEAAPLTPEKVAFAWRTVVGDAIARATHTSLHEGVLWVTADDDRWLEDVDAARGSLLPRLAALLGPGNVTVVKVRHREPR